MSTIGSIQAIRYLWCQNSIFLQAISLNLGSVKSILPYPLSISILFEIRIFHQHCPPLYIFIYFVTNASNYFVSHPYKIQATILTLLLHTSIIANLDSCSILHNRKTMLCVKWHIIFIFRHSFNI